MADTVERIADGRPLVGLFSCLAIERGHWHARVVHIPRIHLFLEPLFVKTHFQKIHLLFGYSRAIRYKYFLVPDFGLRRGRKRQAV